MRTTVLSLTICATFILLINAEQNLNANAPEIKDQMQKRDIVVYEVEPVGTNRNTDDNLNLPPEDPNAASAPNANAPPAENSAAPPGGSSQSGGFGDRKKKDHKEIQKRPAAAEQANVPKKDAKKEEKPVKDLKDGDKAKEENKEEAVTEQPKENKGSEEKESNHEEQKDAKEEETNEEEQDEEEEEGEEEEEDDEEEDDEEEEEDVEGQVAQGLNPGQDAMAADANYSQRGNTWIAEDDEDIASEKELTFRPASLAPEKTASGDKPQSSTFKSRQGVEKIIDTPDVSGATKRTAMAVSLPAAAIVGSLFFSL